MWLGCQDSFYDIQRAKHPNGETEKRINAPKPILGILGDKRLLLAVSNSKRFRGGQKRHFELYAIALGGFFAAEAATLKMCLSSHGLESIYRLGWIILRTIASRRLPKRALALCRGASSLFQREQTRRKVVSRDIPRL